MRNLNKINENIRIIYERNISPGEFYLNAKDLKEFIDKVIKKLALQEPIIRLDANFNNTFIVGDLHGELIFVKPIIRAFLEEKIDTVIFLGDYVDRGRYSLETLLILLGLFYSYPNNVILLKGNHENLNVNEKYGFLKQIYEIYKSPEELDIVIQSIEKLYNYLSIAAITPKGSLCVHGGIPNSIDNISELSPLEKPYVSIINIEDAKLREKIYNSVKQILWNDPIDGQNNLFEPSFRGKDIFTFNQKATEIFLNNSNLKRVIRAHESIRGPYQKLFNGKLIHIFSSNKILDPRKAGILNESDDLYVYNLLLENLVV